MRNRNLTKVLCIALLVITSLPLLSVMSNVQDKPKKQTVLIKGRLMGSETTQLMNHIKDYLSKDYYVKHSITNGYLGEVIIIMEK